MAPTMTSAAPDDTTTYPLDDRLLAALDEAMGRGDEDAEAAARLLLNIRTHKHFRALVLRMQMFPISPTARGFARTEKTALLGEPTPGTEFARTHALARLIVADLDVPDGDEAKAAAALALVLAEECTRPLGQARRRQPDAAT